MKIKYASLVALAVGLVLVTSGCIGSGIRAFAPSHNYQASESLAITPQVTVPESITSGTPLPSNVMDIVVEVGQKLGYRVSARNNNSFSSSVTLQTSTSLGWSVVSGVSKMTMITVTKNVNSPDLHFNILGSGNFKAGEESSVKEALATLKAEIAKKLGVQLAVH